MTSRKPKHILAVDDDGLVRKSLAIFFREAGYESTVAEDGEEALRFFCENRYDLLVTDIRMPGMDGIGLLAEIKRRSPSTEVVMMTSYASLETAVAAIRRDASSATTATATSSRPSASRSVSERGRRKRIGSRGGIGSTKATP